MSGKAAAWIGWSLVAFVAAIPVLILAVAVTAEEELKGDILVIVLVSLLALVCGLVGALVVSRQPGNAVGWLFSVSGVPVVVDEAIQPARTALWLRRRD